ncbi:MAG: signal transduction protein [Pseudomonadota bacterium]
MTRLSLLGLALLGLGLSAPSAQAQEVSAGRALAELTFKMVDEKEKGYVDQGDMELVRGQIFTSVDTNENNSLSLDEFLGWDYGFANIVAEQGGELAYKSALTVVFSFWDRDGDGGISPAEHRRAMIADFNRADLDGDAILNEKEFLSGLSILVAVRSVLNP